MARRLIPRAIDRLRDVTARPVAVASPDPGTTAPLAAILTRRPDDVAGDLGRSADAAAAIARADTRVFAASSHDPAFPISGTRPAALYGPWPVGAFDAVWITRTVPLYDTPWGRAALRRARRMLVPDGRLLVHVGPAGGGRGVLPLDALVRVLGEPLERHRGGVAAFPATPSGVRDGGSGDDGDEPGSVLDWYLDHAASLVIEDLRARTFGPAAIGRLDDRLMTEFMEPGPVREEIGGGEPEHRTPADLDAAIDLAVRRQTYQVGGIAQKAALMRFILGEHFGRRHDLSLADLGGGYGLLAAELLLDPDCGVERAACVDPSPYNCLLAAELYRGLRRRLRGRFRFHPCPGQAFRPESPLDAVSFVGSLLYVPRDETQAVLDRAWESIAPGGLLVVHENIKHPRFTADHDLMFTVEEIDERLGRYGAITRYHTTALERCSKREAGDRAVYRVVAKPTAGG